MADFQNQHGTTTQKADKYCNPVIETPRRDEHGNPAVYHGIRSGTTKSVTHAPPTGPTGFAATTAGGQGTFGHDYHHGQNRGVTGMLRRSASSSSSSSEDDGHGGRRKKKGLKEKIKEKQPGVTTTDTAYGGTAHLGQHREKGMMDDKIKDELPGGDKDDPCDSSHQPTSTTAPYGQTTRYGGETPHEEKGVMDKIKEKLPGSDGHNREEHYSTHTTTPPYGGATTYTEEPQGEEGHHGQDLR